MSVRLLSSLLKALTSLISNRLVMGLKPQQIDLYGLKTCISHVQSDLIYAREGITLRCSNGHTMLIEISCAETWAGFRVKFPHVVLKIQHNAYYRTYSAFWGRLDPTLQINARPF